MSFLTVNHDDAGASKKNEFETIAEGKYEAIVKEVEVTKSKSGNDMIKVTVVIRDDIKQPFAKRKVWDYLVVTEKTKWKLNQVAKAIGIENGTKVATIHEFAKALTYQPVKITVKHEKDEYNGETKTREKIDRYEPTDHTAYGNNPFNTPSNDSSIPF